LERKTVAQERKEKRMGLLEEQLIPVIPERMKRGKKKPRTERDLKTECYRLIFRKQKDQSLNRSEIEARREELAAVARGEGKHDSRRKEGV